MKKTIFALIKCDNFPAEIKRKNAETKKIAIAKMKHGWQTNIKTTLSELGVSQNVVEHIQIPFTTHTEEEKHIDWSLYGENNGYTSADAVRYCMLGNMFNHLDACTEANHHICINKRTETYK